MLAALTLRLIDLRGEWSVNTAEQTRNGTINRGLEFSYHSVPGPRVFAEPRGSFSGRVGTIKNDSLCLRVFLLFAAHERTHTHAHTLGPLTLIIKQKSCARKQQALACNGGRLENNSKTRGGKEKTR